MGNGPSHVINNKRDTYGIFHIRILAPLGSYPKHFTALRSARAAEKQAKLEHAKWSGLNDQILTCLCDLSFRSSGSISHCVIILQQHRRCHEV